MTSELLALAGAEVSWNSENPSPAVWSDDDIDTLAAQIEAQIAEGEAALAEAPEFSLGQRIRGRPFTVQDLMDNDKRPSQS